MRELHIEELMLISGGSNDANYQSFTSGAGVGATIGAGLTALYNHTSGDDVTRAGARFGLLGLVAVGAWNLGTYGYHETPLGDLLNTGIDKLTGLDKVGKQDKSGNNYGH